MRFPFLVCGLAACAQASEAEGDAVPSVASAAIGPQNTEALTASAKPTEEKDKPPVVVLPDVAVNETVTREKLARASVVQPEKEVKLDPFLTTEARDAKLVEKHIAPVERHFLSRFTLPGFSKEKRAREAEAAEKAALGVNSLAEQIEILQQAGASEEEIKKLKHDYYDMMVRRPRRK